MTKNIIKESWPYVGGDEMGNTFQDTVVDSNNYDMMNPEKSVLESQDVYGFEGGALSPVEGHDWEYFMEDADESGEPLNLVESSDLLLRLISVLEKGASILDVCSDSKKYAHFMADRGFDVVRIDSSFAFNPNDPIYNKVSSISGDVRYYNFGKRFDAFHAISCFNDMSSAQLSLKNIYSCLRPIGHGAIYLSGKSINTREFERILHDVGFHVLKKSNCYIDNNKERHTEFIVKKSELNNVASVVIYSDFSKDTCPISRKKIKSGAEKYSFEYNNKIYNFSSKGNLERFSKNPEFYIENKVAFLCDIANTDIDRAIGLQAYQRLKFGSGLLFEYAHPTDVVYHMGTVRYPIDIIFIDNNNKIKKICKNVKPGSSAIFGCSNVKNVLEISGGLCDRLGIYKEKYIDIQRGTFNKKVDLEVNNSLKASLDYKIKSFIKISSVYKTNSYNYKDNKILNIYRDNSLILKKAQNKHSLFSKLYGLKKNDEKNIYAFDIDCILSEKKDVLRLYKNDGQGEFIDISYNELLSNANLKNIEYSVLKGARKSFYNFASTNGITDEEAKKFFRKIVDLSNNDKNKIVFVTRLDNKNGNLIGEVLASKIEDSFGIVSLNIDYDVIRISNKFSNKDTLGMLKQKYSCTNPYLYTSKFAGVKVPDNIKDVAKTCVSDLDKAMEKLKEVKESFEHNYSEYEKIQGDENLIKKTKGKYNQSSKKTKKTTEDALRLILSLVKNMNNIKDISTTEELIDGVVASSKVAIDYIQNVFDVINKFEDPSFIMILSEMTSGAISSIDDCNEALKRMKSYIHNDIMGIVSISD